MPGGIQFTVEQESLRRVAKALRQEEDGKALRKELVSNIKAALEPLRSDVASSIMGMGAGGIPHDGEPLRQAIASKVVVDVRTGGRATGAGIKAKRNGMPRGFANAAKWTNRQSWRHPVFKRVTSTGVEVDVWVDQVGKPRWFDDPIKARRNEFRRSVAKVVDQMARRIARGH